jgi:predicted ester cyclase
MNAIEVVKRYNKAWNDHDAGALPVLFDQGGTYSNPHAGQGLTGEAIVNYAKAVWEAFPDMTVELTSVSEIGSGQVAHRWLLRGTNSGPLMDGSAPTGRTLTLPGNDVIQVEGDKIRSVEVNYDTQVVDDQLGGTPT